MKGPVRESEVASGSADILTALEPDQLVAGRQPLPRRSLKPTEILTFWVLRVYLIVVMAILIYQVFAGSH